MRRDIGLARVLCPECLGDGEFEITTGDPEAIEPPTVLCRQCFGRGYVFIPAQHSLDIPDTELPYDYDPFAEEETEDERDACKV
jgi:hypothetical protein